jgi:hypothetical protein
MWALLRSLLVLLVVVAAVVLAVDLLAPEGEGGTLPAELMVTFIGAVAVLQLLAALGRRWPDVWQRRSPWVDRRSRRGGADPERPEQVREWEALLVTGTTGEARGRERLTRRLAQVAVPGTEPLLDEVRRSPSNQVLALVERFATEVERTHDD